MAAIRSKVYGYADQWRRDPWDLATWRIAELLGVKPRTPCALDPTSIGL